MTISNCESWLKRYEFILSPSISVLLLQIPRPAHRTRIPARSSCSRTSLKPLLTPECPVTLGQPQAQCWTRSPASPTRSIPTEQKQLLKVWAPVAAYQYGNEGTTEGLNHPISTCMSQTPSDRWGTPKYRYLPHLEVFRSSTACTQPAAVGTASPASLAFSSAGFPLATSRFGGNESVSLLQIRIYV